MSLGVHRAWKNYYVHRLNPGKNAKIVDVAGGTGDIAFRILKKLQPAPNGNGTVTLVDINQVIFRHTINYNTTFFQNMIDVGQSRAEENKLLDLSRLNWICADAETLPFEDNSFDLYTIAFGIRNCTHVDRVHYLFLKLLFNILNIQVLREAHRILKPGGKFTCLEFSQINPLLKSVYDLYSLQVIPTIGQIVAGDFNSYKYLVESIRVFPNQVNKQ